MAKSKPLSRPEATLEELLDKVSNAREELVAVGRTLRAPKDRYHQSAKVERWRRQEELRADCA